MPSPRAQRTPKKRTKTFTGCWTCRSRGLKCDGRKPHCQRCERSQRECQGYGIRLYWMSQDETAPPQGMQMRRLFDDADRQNPIYSDAVLDGALEQLDALHPPCATHIEPFGVFSIDPPLTPPALLDDAFSDVSQYSVPTSPSDWDSPLSASAVVATSKTPSPFPFSPDFLSISLSPPLRPYLVSASSEERRLFEHWSSILSGIFLPTPRVDNPFRNVYIPLALGSSNGVSLDHPGHASLMHCIYAISAFHIAEQDPSRADEALIAVKHYKTSLNYLRQSLAMEGEQPEAVFATIQLMVSIYLVVGNSSNWRIHVQGGRDWLKSQVASLRKSQFAPILYQLFRCLEVIGLWHNNANLLPDAERSAAAPFPPQQQQQQQLDHGQITEITDDDDNDDADLANDDEGDETYIAPEFYCLDRYFGLPKPIFDALRRMQQFRRRAAGRGAPPSASELAGVEARIEEVRALVSQLRPSDGINERLLVHHYMVFYYACRINLAREFRGVAPAAVQPLVAECLQHLELTYSIEQAVRVCGISWPLFVTACEAETPDVRERLHRLFDKGRKLGIGSIKQAAKVVRKVWEHRDRTGDYSTRWRQEIMEGMGMDLLLA